MEPELDRLINEIEHAFSSVEYPGDEALIETRGAHLEKEGVRDFFRGKNWREINLDGLLNEFNQDHSACLWFMSDQAVRYYLPAFMKIALMEFDKSDLLADQVVHLLTPERLAGTEFERFLSLVHPFSDEQKSAIAHFLSYMKKYHEHDISEPTPSVALNRFWSRYAGHADE